MTKTASGLQFEAAHYLALPSVQRIAASLQIDAARRAYLPDLSDLRRDWVSSVAAPAFSALARLRPPARRRAFCTIGTGSGIDALAAIEILESESVAITDLFEDVVSVATENVRKNLAPGVAVDVVAGAGDLLSGLPTGAGPFDVIYENLPNLPLEDDSIIAVGRTSGAHLARRSETAPDVVRQNHLVLHWLALVSARAMLAADGVVLSTIGTRVPLATLTEMSRSAGFRPSVLTFGWKLQADPDELFETHAAHQAKGFGPFHFYAADRLEAAFAGLDPATAGGRAFAIEAALDEDRLDAKAAVVAHRSGVSVGHTYAVLASEPGFH